MQQLRPSDIKSDYIYSYSDYYNSNPGPPTTISRLCYNPAPRRVRYEMSRNRLLNVSHKHEKLLETYQLQNTVTKRILCTILAQNPCRHSSSTAISPLPLPPGGFADSRPRGVAPVAPPAVEIPALKNALRASRCLLLTNSAEFPVTRDLCRQALRLVSAQEVCP